MPRRKVPYREPAVITFYDASGEIVGQHVSYTPNDNAEAPEGARFIGLSGLDYADLAEEGRLKEPLTEGRLLEVRREGGWLKVNHPAAVLRARSARATS